MPRTLITGSIYDADTRTLNLEIMEKVKSDPDNKYANWFTRQPWRAEVWFEDNQWRFRSFLQNREQENFSDSDIFDLIKTVLENLGA